MAFVPLSVSKTTWNLNLAVYLLPGFSDITSASFRRLAPAGDADYITEDLALRVVQILGVSRPSWHIGRRDIEDATIFMKDLASRLVNRIQLTTDGHRMYLEAVESAFGIDIDFSQLVKLYGQTTEGQKRYSPPQCIGTLKTNINGSPDAQNVSTSFVERQNLTMRMNRRRFTRLTNAFSKKIENLFYAESLHFMYYNLCRIHQTLRVTPAMEARVTNHVWDIHDILGLL